ncbi:MAG: glutathione S-transferase N-terminal domain-containing protein [Kangiella sp.]|jgi:glutathione S-transferase|nr:glutathione S-transferase N-terminal domain-containing protein [Kangiella sp.]
MKLYYGTTSPYVRKVQVTAIELGLSEQIDFENTLPWESETTLGNINPLGKIPALVTDQGQLIHDSRVICEYFDALAGGGIVIPSANNIDARMACLTLDSMADGMMEAMILVYSELVRRPKDLHWNYWEDRQRGKVDKGLDELEKIAASFDPENLQLGQISLACAVAWLDFREQVLDIDFRNGRPALSEWFAIIDARPSFRQTVPYTSP